MQIIKVKEVSKAYKINKRPSGLPGTIANLFVPKYDIKQAVDNISFSIDEGEMVGFIGPNGAGKSTTIKMLSGILYPDSGSIEIDGFIPYKQRKKYVAKIGAVFGQKSQLSWDLPVIDSYYLLKHIYKIPRDEYRKSLNMFTEMLEMGSFINQPVRQLSLGQRMRADIAAALIHSPKIVFFDEPTIGLDVVAKERIREFIRHMNAEKNLTMIFTTHDMQDIEKTCRRLIIIDKGSKLYDGTVNGIKDEFGSARELIVDFENEYDIEPIFGVEIKKINATKRRFIFENRDIQVQDLIEALMRKYKIKDLTIAEPEIESLVRQIYEGSIKTA